VAPAKAKAKVKVMSRRAAKINALEALLMSGSENDDHIQLAFVPYDWGTNDSHAKDYQEGTMAQAIFGMV
jgi:hypothetical protein